MTNLALTVLFVNFLILFFRWLLKVAFETCRKRNNVNEFKVSTLNKIATNFVLQYPELKELIIFTQKMFS